jgi:hypothetical protein
MQRIRRTAGRDFVAFGPTGSGRRSPLLGAAGSRNRLIRMAFTPDPFVFPEALRLEV